MQQYPRSTPRSAGSGSPQPNTGRTNPPRDQLSDRGSDFESITYSDRLASDGSGLRPSPPGERAGDHGRDAAKLKQIAQRFFTKAALTILSSRVDLPQSFVRDSNQVRTNKWFNLTLDESDQLVEQLMDWANADILETRPDPLIIEIYLDTAELARNRTLVVLDDRGTKWDVCKALEAPGNPTSNRITAIKNNTQIVLERWKLYLGDTGASRGSTPADTPPNVYKKAVILFRALHSFLHLMPAWKFGRRIAKEPATLTALRPLYRILRAEPASKDSLSTPLYPTGDPVTETYSLEPTKCPIGSFNVQVRYRINCDFRVNDLDALLSSHFMGMDDHLFSPSLGDTSGQDVPYWSGRKDVGSLPTERKWSKNPPDQSQAYGSMSTFHRTGHGAATSPISALRAAGELTSESPPPSLPQKIPPDHRTSHSSKSSLRSEGMPPVQRRVSVSFQPFKAGSLSSSPAFMPTSPRGPGSIGAGTSDIARGLAQARNRTSITALPQAALRTPPQPSSEIAVGSPSPSSPKVPPITRYSSSFGHRKPRFSSGSGGGSRTEEDNNSSVRGSQSSSNQPGSGLLAEGEGGSSGSVQTDEDQIADFLKLLDQKKDLRSFNRVDDASKDASTRRTTAALSKYQRLRESHTELTNSLSSSVMLHRSSSASSRAPPLLAGNSVSSSSSPGKPISPHTPHYPAIPSRLSANATIADLESRSGRSQARSARARMDSSPGDAAEGGQPRGDGSTPMDIPTSPQRYLMRRSSSAAQRHRASEDLDDFGLRSASLPTEDRPELSLSELLTMQEPLTGALQPAQQNNPMLQSADSRPDSAELPASSMEESRESGRRGGSTSGSLAPHFRHRLSRNGGRGSPSSFGAGSGESSRAGRYGFTNRPGMADDDEPLVFTMSEIGTQSRRSAENVAGGRLAGSHERSSGRGSEERGPNREKGNSRGGTIWP